MKRLSYLLISVFICALAWGLVVHRLDSKSIWLDESFTYYQSLRLPNDAINFMSQFGNMWLYFGVSRLATAVNDVSPFVFRLPAALFAVIAVAAAIRLGARIADRRAGLAAGLLLAVNPFFVEYGQEARSYTMWIALALIATLALLQSDGFKRRRWAAVYVIAAVGMMYAHLLTPAILIAHALWGVFRYRTQIIGRSIAVGAAFGVGVAPMLYFSRTWIEGDSFNWMPPFDLFQLEWMLREEWGGGTFYLVGLLAAGALWAVWKQPRGAWTLLALIIVSAILVPIIGDFFVSRYAIIALPALIIWGAWGMTRARWTLVGVAAAIMLSLGGVVQWYDKLPRQDWRTLARTVLVQSQPNDAVMFLPFYLDTPYRYEAHSYAARAQTPPALPIEIETYTASYTPPVSNFARVWLILDHDPNGDSSPPPDLASYTHVETWIFEGEYPAKELRLYQRQ